MDCRSTQSSCAGNALLAQYPPYDCETVSQDLARVFSGPSPTLRQAARQHTDNMADEWLTKVLDYMTQLAGIDIDPGTTVASMLRTIKARYGWMKLTEVMHMAYLFRCGELVKVYGKTAACVTVMEAFAEYAKQLNGLRREALSGTDPEDQPWVWNYATETTNAIARFMQSEEYRKAGEWRGEPWAAEMARSYFVDKTLETFPGDMGYEDREAWAKAHNAPTC